MVDMVGGIEVGRKLAFLIILSLVFPSIASVQALVYEKNGLARSNSEMLAPAALVRGERPGAVSNDNELVSVGVSHRFPANYDEKTRERVAGFEVINASDDSHLDVVIGSDDRQQVTNTTNFPNSAIAFVYAWNEALGVAFGCTASFVGPNVLLTAAHCLYILELGGWPDGILVVPGLNGDSEPFGFDFASHIWVASGWISAGGNINLGYESDYGLIVLSNDLSAATGRFTVNVLTDASLQKSDFYPSTAGYPGDKPEGTQWFGSSQMFKDVQPGLLVSDIDIFQGQSGSPVWRGSDLAVVGIVSFDDGFDNYAKRISLSVMNDLNAACGTLGCSINYVIEENEPPAPTPSATPTQPPPPPQPSPTATSVPDEGGSAFQRTWERTDKPVALGMVSRTWMWGPNAFTGMISETYADASGGSRKVLYHDKSRMEITDPNGDPNSIWYVTNGLLVVEMVTGKLQLGNAYFEQHQPAQINVAGDANDPTGPTYSSFATVLSATPRPVGTIVTERLRRDGTASNDPSLFGQGVTVAVVDEVTSHSIVTPFWEFMTSSGIVYLNGAYIEAPLFENPYFATGRPISEAYWATVLVGGVSRDVLIQCFERRCLTFTPGNSAGFVVEAGNVGQHYYHWRYEVIPTEQPPAPQPTPTSTPEPPQPQPTPTSTPTPAPTQPGSDAPQEGDVIGWTDFSNWTGTTYNEGEMTCSP